MSSFLCFICHSTVNADTNEDTREKYREVVGMHLCPDSHLCHICCHVLNKLSLFRAVCLKRSLEYPVLFSEKGTINLQRNDLEFLTLCPEETCGQYHSRNINSKTYNFHCSSDNFDNFNEFNQFQHHNDLVNSQYVELKEDHVNDYFNNKDKGFDGNNLVENMDDIQSNVDDNCAEDYSDDSEANYMQNEENGDSIDQRYTENHNDDENIVNYENPQNVHEENFQLPNEHISVHRNHNTSLPQAVNNEINLSDVNINDISKVDKDNNIDQNNMDEDDVYDLKDTDTHAEVDNLPDNDMQEVAEDESLNLETEMNTNQPVTETKHKRKKEKKKRKYKEFKTVILNLEQQKAELEARRRTKKYLEAEFKCYSCALGFLFKDTYQAHMMRHEESNGEHKCPTCSLRFASPAVLRAHTAAHAQRHRCKRCCHTVRGRARAAHARKCGGGGAACHLCGRTFRDSTLLQQHLKRLHRVTHTNRRLCVCGVCATTHDNPCAVRTHMIKHITRKFSCDTCQSTFSSPYTLNQHKKSHAPAADLHYCVSCNIGYKTRKSLLAHQRNALAHRTTVLECAICGRSCPNHRSLTAHMESVHSHTKNYVCTHCNNRYTNRKSLLRHLRSHEQIKVAKKCVCHMCGSCFKETSKLNRHLREVCEKAKLEEEIAILYDQEC